jgi:hypothetical protein
VLIDVAVLKPLIGSEVPVVHAAVAKISNRKLLILRRNLELHLKLRAL